MGLLDQVSSAKGDTTANYAKAGRHVVRLTRAYFRDPAEDPGIEKLAAGFDGEILATSSPKHSKGETVRVNPMFKYIGNDLARIRRALTAAKTVKENKAIDEATLGLTKNEGESDKDFALRIGGEAKRLTGPTQPLKGAIVVFDVVFKGSGKPSKDNLNEEGGYTLFEVLVPTADDLKALTSPAAALVP